VVVRRLHSGHPCLSLPSVFTYKYRGGEHKSGTHKKERVDRPKEKKYPKRKKEEKKEENKTEEELPPTPPLLEPPPPLAITDD
jgi:hypothetical protein